MSNENAGMKKLAKDWVWVDAGLAERKMEDGTILRLITTGDVERRHGGRMPKRGWIAQVVRIINDGEDEEILKEWWLDWKSAWTASIEVNVQHPHIAPYTPPVYIPDPWMG